MYETFWDRLRDNIAHGIRIAADRTDELARVGKLKLDLLSLKRKLIYEMGEIGKHLVSHVDKTPRDGDLGTVRDFVDQKDVKEHFDRIDTIRRDIAEVEKRLMEATAPDRGKSDAQDH